MRNTQRTFVETAAEASDLFQAKDDPMNRIEMREHVSGGLDSKSDKLEQEEAGNVNCFDESNRRDSLRRRVPDVLSENNRPDALIAFP